MAMRRVAKRWYAPGETGKHFGIATETLRALYRAGKLPPGAVLELPGGGHRYDPVLIEQAFRQGGPRS